MKSILSWLFGFSYLKKIYQKYYNTPEFKENFWNTALNIFNIRYSILNSEYIPNSGAVIIVCNHPFGLLDGLIITNIICQKRSDYKILINDEISQVDLIRPYLIPLKLDGKKNSIKFNLQSKEDAINHVKDGGALIIFPSGEVATKETLLGNVIEKKWQSILGSIVRKTNAKICPVYFKGNNSMIFQITGLIYYPLRRILFARELINKKNKFFESVCLPPLNTSQFTGIANADIADQLRNITLQGEKIFNNLDNSFLQKF